MNKSKLIELLSSADEEDVFVEIDGALYDIEIDHISEQFDGFYTLYPAYIAIKPKEEK